MLVEPLPTEVREDNDEKKEERTMRGLDLLHWDGDRLVRKITYKQD